MAEYDALLRKYRKRPLAEIGEGAAASLVRTDFGRTQIERLVPHRDPFLLVDRIIAVDLAAEGELIVGRRLIDPGDPILAGHFPGFPVYPGSLQLEMGGQLGLCLTHFVRSGTVSVPDDAQPAPVRATRVLGALFLEPLLPGTDALLFAQRLDYDGTFGTVLSQVIADGKVTCVSVAEVVFLD
jgi:3-hydroxymyristoyl/3-hydroxydecanoyl-(acyl carrier protein) dehydratase